MTKLTQHLANLHKHAELVSEGFSSEKALKLVAEQEPQLSVSQVYKSQLNLISDSLNQSLLIHLNNLTPATFERVVTENRFVQWSLQINIKYPFKLTHIQMDDRNGWMIGFYDYITEIEELVVPLHCLSIDERMKFLECIERVI